MLPNIKLRSSDVTPQLHSHLRTCPVNGELSIRITQRTMDYTCKSETMFNDRLNRPSIRLEFILNSARFTHLSKLGDMIVASVPMLKR